MIDQVNASVSDFDYWFENVVSEANLIASPTALPLAWLNGEKGLTSAYDIYELLEQLLGDLHLDQHLVKFEDNLRRLGVLKTITPFVHDVLDLERYVRNDSSLLVPENLVISLQWRTLVKSAQDFATSATTIKG